MADPRVTQDPVEIVKKDDGSTVVSQDPVELATHRASPQVNISQGTTELVLHVLPPGIDISQCAVEIVGKNLFDDDHYVNVCVVT